MYQTSSAVSSAAAIQSSSRGASAIQANRSAIQCIQPAGGAGRAVEEPAH